MADRETFKKRIETDLSEEEIGERKDQLVDAVSRLFSIKAKKSEAMQGYNAELKATREEEQNLIGAIRTGKDTEEVEVYEQQLKDRDVVQIVRADTFEVLEERAMTVDERQGKLDLEGAASNDSEDEDDPEEEAATGDANFPPGKPAPRGRRPRVH